MPKNKTELTCEHIAETLAGILVSDSGVPLKDSLPKLTEAVKAECAATPVWVAPTDKEMEQLVMGDDEGTVPPALRQRFKHIDKALKSFF